MFRRLSLCLKKSSKFRNTIQPTKVFLLVCIALSDISSADIPQTHDVPLFHNDDGLGLLQDCRLMRAIAVGEITEIPSTVNARSTNCLASIKSILQLMYSMKHSATFPATCIPSIEQDWLEVLQYVTGFMENQAPEILASKSYGEWIMLAIQEKYPCV